MFKNAYLLTVALLVLQCFFGQLSAQEANNAADTLTQAAPPGIWSRKGSLSFSLANVGLQNWQGGGQSSLSLGVLFDGNITRKTARSQWRNYINAAFGVARLGENDGTNIFKKTDDQLILGSNYDYTLSKAWSLNAAVELRTQMAPGYTFDRDSLGREFVDKRISDFFAPAFLVPNIGFKYQNKHLQATISPLASRLTFVLSDELSAAGAFGVEPGKRLRSEFGYTLNAVGQLELMKNVTLKSTLVLFSDYRTPDIVTVNWDNLLVFKINEFFFTSFTTQLFYDHNILIAQADGRQIQAVQFKHVLNLNVGFKF